MSQAPTWWFNTEHFWKNYPEWRLLPEMKRYYLTQTAYWLHQFIVLVLGLEKPRKDFYELVAHHIVTLWMVGWSYLMNLTFIGNAVFLSMDIPDAFFAFSKLLNYIQYNTAKTFSFAAFVVVWTYFRHWQNWRILYSVWYEFPTMSVEQRQWLPEAGLWLPDWLRYQLFLGIGALQLLNIFWYFLILRVMVRAFTAELTDERSDDEDDENDKED